MTTILIIFWIALAAFVIYKINQKSADPVQSGGSENHGKLSSLIVLTTGWPSSIKIKSLSRKNESYIVNLAEQTCQCPNFQDERSRYKVGDPKRFCKHMVKALVQNSKGYRIPDAVHKLFSDASRAGKGLYFDDYKIVTISGSDAVVSKSHDGDWYAVIVQESGGAARYSYNPSESRWSYRKRPGHADKFVSLINGWYS